MVLPCRDCSPEITEQGELHALHSYYAVFQRTCCHINRPAGSSSGGTRLPAEPVVCGLTASDAVPTRSGSPAEPCTDRTEAAILCLQNDHLPTLCAACSAGRNPSIRLERPRQLPQVLGGMRSPIGVYHCAPCRTSALSFPGCTFVSFRSHSSPENANVVLVLSRRHFLSWVLP